MKVIPFAAALLAAAVPLAPATAQTRTHVDRDQGFRIKVPRWLEAVPVKPGDRQTLAKFEGKKESKVREFRGERSLTLFVVHIVRQAPTTGAGEDGPRSIADQRRDKLNEGTTLKEYLGNHGLKNDVEVNATRFSRRPIKSPDGREYTVYELYDHDYKGALIRGFVLEDDSEIFGLVAAGGGAEPFERDILRAVRSLERGQFEDGDDDDPYAGSELRDLDRRRDVRADLVDGWEAYDTENFILVTNVRSKRLIDDVLVDLEVMREAYLARFPPVDGADMDAVSTVRVCDGYDDYLKYAGRNMDGTGGYWAFLDEELVLFNPAKRIPKARPWLKKIDALAILYHEAMHQYFHYSNGQLAPGSWFNEGYGEVFGGAAVDRRKREIKKLEPNKFRMAWVKESKKRDAWPDLGAFLRMSQREFYGASALQNYAFAWSFCYFLEHEAAKKDGERNEAWASIPETYLRHLRAATDRRRAKLPKDAPADWVTGMQDEIQAEAYEATFGDLDILALERAWVDFMQKEL